MSRLYRAALAAALASVPATAFAQANVQPRPEESGGDIVVTAQKTEQRLADVPISITAVTGSRLEQLGTSELDEIARYVPGLVVQEQSANNPGFVIRGITSDSGSSQEGARVTLYYNGVDTSRSRGAYQDLYDIERIEVVKGPQSTLFGTAAEVGAISIISARPKPGFSGALEAGYGNYDQYRASGFLNVGNDVIAGRLAFAYKHRDGYVRNIAGDPDVPNQNQGKVNQDDLNGEDQRGLRGSLRWHPTETVTVDLIGTYDGQRNPGTAFKSRVFPPTGGYPAGKAFDDFGPAELSGSPFSAQVLGARKLGLDRNVYDANLTVSWEINDGLTLTTVNGYRRFHANEVFDADGSDAFYLEFAEDAKGQQYSHETRLTYHDDHWRVFGGFNGFFERGFQRVPFSTEEGTYLSCSVSPTLAAVRAVLASVGAGGCVAANGTIPATRATAILTRGAATVLPYQSVFQNGGRNDTYSAFGDVTHIPVPAVELTAGARVLIEKRRSSYSSVQPNSVILAALGVKTSLLGLASTGGQTFHAQESFDAVLPRANILWKAAPNLNLYFTYAKGRRSPVVQLDAVAGAGGTVPRLQNVSEERLSNYEGGIKASRGPFSVEAAVYYETYDNFQVSVIGADGVARTQSAGTASNLGGEIQAEARLHRYLTAFGTFNYIDAGIDNDPRFGAFAGDQFRLQPKYQASGGLTARVPVHGLTLYATPSVTYQSHIFFELPNNPAIATPGYTLVNIRAGIEGSGGRWTIGGFARNVTNKHYLLDAGNTGGGFGDPTYIEGEPRFYGVEAGVRF